MSESETKAVLLNLIERDIDRAQASRESSESRATGVIGASFAAGAVWISVIAFVDAQTTLTVNAQWTDGLLWLTLVTMALALLLSLLALVPGRSSSFSYNALAKAVREGGNVDASVDAQIERALKIYEQVDKAAAFRMSVSTLALASLTISMLSSAVYGAVTIQ